MVLVLHQLLGSEQLVVVDDPSRSVAKHQYHRKAEKTTSSRDSSAIDEKTRRVSDSSSAIKGDVNNGSELSAPYSEDDFNAPANGSSDQPSRHL